MDAHSAVVAIAQQLKTRRFVSEHADALIYAWNGLESAISWAAEEIHEERKPVILRCVAISARTVAACADNLADAIEAWRKFPNSNQ